MSDVPKIYLDANVIAHMCDGLKPELKSEVIKASEVQRAVFPFTAGMVSEVANIYSIEEAMQRLVFLSEISQGWYLEHSAYNFGLIRRRVFQVYDDLRARGVGSDAAKHFRRLVPHDTHKATAKAYEMIPSVMNNLAPAQLFKHINQRLSEYEYPVGSEDHAPRNIDQCVDLEESLVRKHYEGIWRQRGLEPENMMRGLKHQVLFNLLESFGYWPDKLCPYEKGSAFEDAAHTFLSSSCDYLVTSDKKHG
ncbi:hypothetical protein GCM10022278_40570 [Allohahella marinimesophila]|uniref:PIN domain-containing protein n=2 Tax=Allohahella marinimesophila TaxID=1054972 RepID=A0ABP7QFF2_9GAMM